MDGSFFAFALVGALVGYIVGDFQRERRYRREARSNLAQSIARSNDRTQQRAAAVRNTSTDSNLDGPAFALGNVRHGEARRRAVRGDNDGLGSRPVSAGRRSRSADASPVMVGAVSDFDGD